MMMPSEVEVGSELPLYTDLASFQVWNRSRLRSKNRQYFENVHNPVRKFGDIR